MRSQVPLGNRQVMELVKRVSAIKFPDLPWLPRGRQAQGCQIYLSRKIRSLDFYVNLFNCQQLVRVEHSIPAGDQCTNPGDVHLPAGLCAHSVFISFLLSFALFSTFLWIYVTNPTMHSYYFCFRLGHKVTNSDFISH